ncbi:MAG: 50S ribosomal protein L22 [Alphaproteobacteria bacterium]|nr:MAG: 50S ribosomal protein L22 [Alphaproteobacteria bacterium]TAF40934.1 MAG: 50S ribosomal protein L22 [Alphaproteobacteria bacterium]TAF77045.1 MAG: 50S ribosomal protein L22 [Alphaproteobacteria bacterium]
MSEITSKSTVVAKEAKATLSGIHVSPQKLNLIASSIRRKHVSEAITQLNFSSRRASNDVRKLLQSAIANAENNHGYDIDRLVVKEAWVGKSMALKRFRARARGRGARVQKTFSNITIVVSELE